jgi:uncharacterized protein (DUF885 family)
MAITIAPEHLADSEKLERVYLEKVEAIDPRALDEPDLLTRAVFLRGRIDAIEGFRFPGHLLPVNQFMSMPGFLAQMGSGNTVQPFESVEDYDNWLKRLARWPAWVEQAIVNMRAGAEAGVTQPTAVMKKTLPQLAAHIVSDPADSLFYRPVMEMPDGIPIEDRTRLMAAYEKTIAETVVPGYRRLRDFIRDEYMPRTRSTVGLAALPQGSEWYAHAVRIQTSTDLTPQQIHEIGLTEVARIKQEISRARRAPAAGSSRAGNYRSEEEMLDAYRSLRKRVDAALPGLFDRFPEADYEIRAVEKFRQRSAAGGSYMAASPDGTRPGIFYVNTRNWSYRNPIGSEALFLHEAVPGHHFQISIQRELRDLPRFRRFGNNTAYTEGWGLYAESLGRDLGLYRDPEQRIAALGSELFRAKRLVVDTGIHALGWSRRKAIDYLGSESEVERYIVLPGQALAYKIGELEIMKLRKRAEKKLGKRFDVRAFHGQVLGGGALPLDVLADKIDRWISSVL